jgi:hypothetical protein
VHDDYQGDNGRAEGAYSAILVLAHARYFDKISIRNGRFVALPVLSGLMSQWRVSSTILRRTTTTPHDANSPAGVSWPNQKGAKSKIGRIGISR